MRFYFSLAEILKFEVTKQQLNSISCEQVGVAPAIVQLFHSVCGSLPTQPNAGKSTIRESTRSQNLDRVKSNRDSAMNININGDTNSVCL